MKIVLSLMVLMLSGLASAESAKFAVPRIAGEIKLEKSNVKITSLEAVATLQHCNFWGTTCAGGPSEEAVINLNFKQDARTNLVNFSSSKEVNLSSSFLGKRFSSCKLSINMRGRDGQSNVEGFSSIIFNNDIEFCKSKYEVSNYVQNLLKTPIRMNSFPVR